MANVKSSVIAEYGDFQTPTRLAAAVCKLLAERAVQPATIIEPTCGVGNFLIAARAEFAAAKHVVGVDVNDDYIQTARARMAGVPELEGIEMMAGDFYNVDWGELLSTCPEPVLMIGNPPWVTNTQLSKLGSGNAPMKSNRGRLTGYEAISGKSNFDISEWMLVRLLQVLDGRDSVLAMLCKTSVARKVLTQAWRSQVQMQSASMHLLDAKEAFGVAVHACLLICILRPGCHCSACSVHPDLSSRDAGKSIGVVDGHLVASVEYYLRWRELLGEERYRWRSGVKHDCSSVMELRRTAVGYVNGLGERVEVDDAYVFPLFKSADIARGRIAEPTRYVIVTQRRVGDQTRAIQGLSPKTWQYLERHAGRLDNRRSTIYAQQPRFAVFGVGDYTFAPWKVAVSGLYDGLEFRILPPFEGKPSVLDDTCYFLACDSEGEASYICSLLESRPAKELYEAFLFPDSKRPVTAELLRRLDLLALARVLGSEDRMLDFLKSRGDAGRYGSDAKVLQGVLIT